MQANALRPCGRVCSSAVLTGFAFCLITRLVAQAPPETGFPSLLLPPLTGVHTCDQVLTYPGVAGLPSVQIRDLRLQPPASSQAPPAPGAPPVVQTFTTTASAWILWSEPAGFQPVTMTANVTVRVAGSSADPLHFDTEMLQLDLTGTGPLGPFMIRESPSLASTGAARIKMPDPNSVSLQDPAAWFASNFDIFTEISSDGGQSWTPATGSGRVTLSAPSAENSFPSNALPPSSSVHRVAGPVVCANGVVIRNLALRDLLSQQTPPPPGASNVVSSPATVTGELSLDGGATFTPFTCPGNLSEQVTSLADNGNVRYFDTEMLALNLSGGSLPQGVMIRESPTKASLGRTSLRQTADNRYRISSFFDIWTEITIDAGQSWSPASNGACVCALSHQPPDHFATTDCFPPPADFVSNRGDAVSFGTTGVVIRHVSDRPLSRRAPLPAPGTTETRSLQCETSLEVSLDGGATFTTCLAHTLKEMLITSVQVSSGGESSMECLSFDLTTSPGGLLVRESPTKASLGRTTSRTVSGGFMFRSFFDIFTEISVDGGASWTPADQALQLSLLPYMEAQNIFSHTFQPPRDGSLEMRRFENPVSCDNGVHIRKLSLDSFSSAQPLPVAVCDPQTASFACNVACEMSTDDGLNWTPVSTTASGTMSVSRVRKQGEGQKEYFDTEMLSLDLSAAGLPASIRVRESPTKQSLGRCSVESLSDGGYRIDSFFDIFVDLSVDGGTSWVPAANPAPLACRAQPARCHCRSGWLPPALECRTRDNQLFCWAGQTGIRALVIETQSDITRVPLPAPGAASVASFTAPVEFDLTLDGGATTTRARCDAPLSYVFSDLLVTSYSSVANECVQFDLSGGTLPAGVMVRESPTRASTGRTTQRVTDGGYRIESFFDIFTEISLDSGQTWTPVCSPLHLECRETPNGLVSSSGTRLPLSQLVATPGAIPPRSASGLQVAQVELKPRIRLAPPPVAAPAPGHKTTVFDTCDVDFLYSADNGQTFTPLHAEAFYRYEMENTMISGYSRLDTEMLQLEFSGGTMPAGMMIRESPTLPSKGRTSSVRGLSDGSFQVDSFFDIFTEISLDGGHTWEPFDVPISCQFESLIDSCVVASPSWPPPGHLQGLAGDPDPHVLFSNGANASNFDIFVELAGTPLPPPGTSSVHNAVGTCRLHLTPPGGAPPLDCVAEAAFAAQFTHAGSDAGGRSFFDTEMLQLSLTGGTLPPGVMVRESPTLPSKGKTTIRAAAAGGGGGAGGGFMLDSFFDIFTEISLDSGQTWSASDAPLRLAILNPDIDVTSADGTAIADGGSVNVNANLTSTLSTLSIEVAALTIRNTGTADLTGLEAAFDGPDATSFSVISPPVAPVPPGGSTTCKIGFASSSPGTKSAVLHFASNDPDESPFDITFTAVALMPDDDDDNDGVSNKDELALRACGLDPLVDSAAAIQELRDSGFFRASDMHALALGNPVLERDPATGHFILQLLMRKTPDLLTWSPLTGFAPTCDPDTGIINLDIAPDGSSAQFYQVLGQLPPP